MTVTQEVALIDLTSTDIRALLARRFSDTLADLAGGAHSGTGTAQVLLLVVDRARDLTQHAPVYEHIFSANIDVPVVCVALGPMGADGILHRPDLLGRHEKTATLWLADAQGVAWGMETSVASAVHGGAGSGRVAATPPALLDALRRPEVFRAVIEAAGGMPARAASPGLRAVRAQISADRFHSGVAAALARLTRQDGSWTRKPVALRVADPAVGGAAGPAVIRIGGRVDKHYQAAHEAALEARAVVDQWHGDLPATMRRAAQALRALSADAEEVIDLIDPRDTPDPEYRAGFELLGLETAAAPPAGPNPALEELAAAGFASFDERGALPVLADRLRAVADRFGGDAREQYRRRLRPEEVEATAARMENVGPVSVGRWTPGLSYLLALCAALAGVLCIGSTVPAAAVTLAAGWGAAAWYGSRMRRIGLGVVAVRQTVLLGAAVTVGAAAGTGAMVGSGWSGLPGALGIALGVAIDLLLVGIVSQTWTRLLIANMRRHTTVVGLGVMVDQVRAVIEEVARVGRRAAERQYEVCDYARVLAAVVGDIGKELEAGPEPDPQDGSAPPAADLAGIDAVTSQQLQAQISEVDEIVLGDLSDAAAAAFAVFADPARRRPIRMPAEGEAGTAMAERLDDYLRHVERSGVHHPPPWCRDPEGRARLLDRLWGRSGNLAELTRSDARDVRLTQFCAPEDLRWLESDAAAARLVRFAPQAAESVVAWTSAGAERHPPTTVWTEDGRLLGVLRLVPLRAGVVADDLQAEGQAPPSWEPGRWAAEDSGAPDLDDALLDDDPLDEDLFDDDLPDEEGE
ncbi:hypothetical protein ABH920_007887 [Catenulispora sp. EB89]|uniref:hypothetical protein n=1 Tax=Catenulispora sp. EB89 TaxID=3156257 RepID=UPI003516D491